MIRRRAARGSSVLYVVILSPVLLLSLALAVELGALQLQRQRLHSAVDQAAVVAASSSAFAGGVVGFDSDAAVGSMRRSLVENLRPLADDIDGTTPDAIAAEAEIAVITTVPAPDPFDPAATVLRPTIEARVRVPVRTGLLHTAGVPAQVTLTIVAGADLRVIGRDRT